VHRTELGSKEQRKKEQTMTMKSFSAVFGRRNDMFMTWIRLESYQRPFSRSMRPLSSTTASSSSQTNRSKKIHPQNNGKSQLSFVTLKQTLLKEALEQHVKIYGFTNEAIAAATASNQQQNNNISMATAGLISTSDLVSYAMEHYNSLLKKELKQKVLEWKNTSETTPMNSAGGEKTQSMTDVDKISWALQRRLEYVQELVQNQKWASGMAIGARPDNVWTTRTQLENMINIVVNELDLNCSFVERLSLGTVYVTTELHMLADTSPQYQDTWLFLRQRVQDWNHWREWQKRIDLPTNLLGTDHSWKNYHTPSDVLFTASTVASALLSGAASVLGTSTHAKPFLFSGQSDDNRAPILTKSNSDKDDGNDGTDPSHYDVPAKEKNELL
jgi:ubiquinone biosynthesis protein COQ9